jgi:hypothetical protein
MAFVSWCEVVEGAVVSNSDIEAIVPLTAQCSLFGVVLWWHCGC